MLVDERHNILVDLINKEGTVTKKRMAQLLNVSLETIRRDLDVLADKQLINKVHGGATSRTFFPGKYPEMDYSERKNMEKGEKEEIATIALKEIKENDSIVLNGGTTNEVIAEKIVHRYKRLTIVTNSLHIVNILKEDRNLKVILCGGVYNQECQAFLGSVTEAFLHQFSVDTCFLGVSGIDLAKGCTDYHEGEVFIQKKMIEIANKVIVVSTSNKFNSCSLLHVCDLDEVDAIISDSKLPSEIREQYENAGYCFIK